MIIDAPWLTSNPSQRLCAAFEGRGYQIYFVGGCVRNELLGQRVSDLDLATDATPSDVIDLAKSEGIKAIPTGIDHGTVTLVMDDLPYEVTTFRHDVETDGRKATVAYSNDLGADAKRRDFTMNALYADARGTILDPVSGLPDLKSGVIRFIGDAEQRIREDYLRILRFFRFNAWYATQDAGIDADGLSACAKYADQLQTLSKERITAELLKLLSANDPSMATASMAASSALIHSLPGASSTVLAPYVHIEAEHGIELDPLARLAALGGDPVSDLRLSRAQQTILGKLNAQFTTPQECGYRLRDLALKNLALVAARMGQDLDTKQVENAKNGMNASFPISASDLMPKFEGQALGQRLRELEQRWIDADFELSREQLLA